MGARVDYWHMDIYWKDINNTPAAGTTRIGVVQPTFDIGMVFTFYRKWLVSIYGGIGQEINVMTQGDEVGQGGMWLGGVTLCRNLVGLKNRKSVKPN